MSATDLPPANSQSGARVPFYKKQSRAWARSCTKTETAT